MNGDDGDEDDGPWYPEFTASDLLGDEHGDIEPWNRPRDVDSQRALLDRINEEHPWRRAMEDYDRGECDMVLAIEGESPTEIEEMKIKEANYRDLLGEFFRETSDESLWAETVFEVVILFAGGVSSSCFDITMYRFSPGKLFPVPEHHRGLWGDVFLRPVVSTPDFDSVMWQHRTARSTSSLPAFRCNTFAEQDFLNSIQEPYFKAIGELIARHANDSIHAFSESTCDVEVGASNGEDGTVLQFSLVDEHDQFDNPVVLIEVYYTDSVDWRRTVIDDVVWPRYH